MVATAETSRINPPAKHKINDSNLAKFLNLFSLGQIKPIVIDLDCDLFYSTIRAYVKQKKEEAIDFEQRIMLNAVAQYYSTTQEDVIVQDLIQAFFPSVQEILSRPRVTIADIIDIPNPGAEILHGRGFYINANEHQDGTWAMYAGQASTIDGERTKQNTTGVLHRWYCYSTMVKKELSGEDLPPSTTKHVFDMIKPGNTRHFRMICFIPNGTIVPIVMWNVFEGLLVDLFQCLSMTGVHRENVFNTEAIRESNEKSKPSNLVKSWDGFNDAHPLKQPLRPYMLEVDPNQGCPYCYKSREEMNGRGFRSYAPTFTQPMCDTCATTVDTHAAASIPLTEEVLRELRRFRMNPDGNTCVYCLNHRRQGYQWFYSPQLKNQYCRRCHDAISARKLEITEDNLMKKLNPTSHTRSIKDFFPSLPDATGSEPEPEPELEPARRSERLMHGSAKRRAIPDIDDKNETPSKIAKPAKRKLGRPFGNKNKPTISINTDSKQPKISNAINAISNKRLEVSNEMNVSSSSTTPVLKTEVADVEDDYAVADNQSKVLNEMDASSSSASFVARAMENPDSLVDNMFAPIIPPELNSFSAETDVIVATNPHATKVLPEYIDATDLAMHIDANNVEECAYWLWEHAQKHSSNGLYKHSSHCADNGIVTVFTECCFNRLCLRLKSKWLIFQQEQGSVMKALRSQHH